MKAEELMIGNLVRVGKDVCFKKDTIVKIRGIDADREFPERGLKGCATCVPIDNPDGLSGGVWLEYLEPILLPDEILKKLGFKLRKVVGWKGVKNYFWKADNVRVRFISLIYENISFFDLIIEPVDSDDLRRGDLRCAIGGFSRFTPVRYVHEMQQAFRFNGIDKELNLTKEE